MQANVQGIMGGKMGTFEGKNKNSYEKQIDKVDFSEWYSGP